MIYTAQGQRLRRGIGFTAELQPDRPESPGKRLTDAIGSKTVQRQPNLWPRWKALAGRSADQVQFPPE